MPVACAGPIAPVKYAYLDHDINVVNPTPVVQNVWYTGIDDEDVRHIWCAVRQTNGEAAAKDFEVRWTIDGTPYFTGFSLANNALTYIFKNREPSTGGTKGLTSSATGFNPAGYVDKRGQVYKTEIRLTSAPGTNQVLNMWSGYETLEVT